MKTGGSIPDDLFEDAERQAAGLTEAMNRALEGIDQMTDVGLQEAGRRTFQRSEWI